MKINTLLLSCFFLFAVISGLVATNPAGGANLADPYSIDVMATDTIPLKDRTGNFITNPNSNPFDLNDPPIIDKQVEYDPTTGNYIIMEKIGDDYFRTPTYMTFEEYTRYTEEQQRQQYFKELAGVSSGSKGYSGLADPLEKIDVDRDIVNRLFGGTKVDIRPQGTIDLTFGIDRQRILDPNRTIRQQRTGGFDFNMAIQMSATGQIGEKLKLGFNYNTQATFDFDNQMKLEYSSDNFSDDEIVKSIEAGHVSLPLRGSLIQGAQSLFGIKTELQFGRLRLTALASQQKSQRENLQIQGGSQLQEFELGADEYDENRHFFVSHYNRSVFENALSTMPQINSLFRINQIQVWVTNDRNEVNNVRDIVALADIGEATRITNDNPQFQLPATPRHKDLSGKALPGRKVLTDVDANRLHDVLRDDPRARQLDASVSVLEGQYNFNQTKDYEKVSARLLTNNEFVVNNELGFVSLNVNLQPDQVLAVAYTYEYNGEVYKVGEFADDAYDSDTLGVIFVKMLKSTTQRVDLPAWDLMMKNVYSIGAFQVAQEDFRLDIFYEDPGEGEKRFIPEPVLADKPMLQIFNLDRLNTLGDPYPDGQFDFVSGITINPNNGRVMFPVLEPFGSALAEEFDNESLARQYTYPILYDSTVIRAREYPEFNRFTIRGSYKSSISSEISLGAFNLPPGSVTIRAGGQVLIEGNDYEVDYNIGRVKILNDAILNSGLPINVSFEDNTLFGFQTKTLLGIRADYEVSKNMTIGGTYMHLFERPFTQKVNIGDDPISNRIYGLDVNYSKDAPWLTKAVDKIPFIDTKQPSSINFMAEAALLRPGHAKAINQGDDGGVVFVDDFEGSTSGVTLTLPANAWTLASVPQNDAQNNNPNFPESRLVNDVRSGMNRAHMSWFRLDQSVGSGSNENPYTTQIPQLEVFPNRTIQPGTASTIQGLVLSYYPRERGPYNFDLPDGGTDISAGLTNNGGLQRPDTRWGGIMRDLNTNDFQAANIEYLEFWMLNPFMDQGEGVRTEDGGEMCINLGNISEDILRDSRKFFENGITTNGTTEMDNTNWSRVPRVQAITNAFDNDPEKRPLQDIGYDGQDDDGEKTFFEDFMTAVAGSALTQVAKEEIDEDPSSDNFKNPRDDSEFPEGATTLDRYKYANGPEGNSPIAQGNQSVLGNRNPDTEDLNQDNTLSETESYFQYCIPIQRTTSNEMALSQFVTDTIHGPEQNGQNRVWYRFKVPLDQYTGRVGGIQDFRSIRFIRMYLRGFEDQINIRFATLDLIRNQWRRYQRPLQVYKDISNGGVTIGDPDGESNTLFDVNAVSIEENGGKIPFNYVLPLGITQERSTNTTFPDQLQNEQSLALEVCNLEPEAARGIYKIINLDMRVYDNMQMYVHAEATNPELNLEAIPDGDLSLFIRLGSDFEQNYYEYELPLTMSRDAFITNVNSDAYKEEVWKEENDVNIDFEFLREVKIARNDAGFSLAETFEMMANDTTNTAIRVKGNPNLGLVKGIMVGIINRSEQAHCAEVWINELRVAGIDERGGAAGLARLDLQLADFANVTASVSGSTIGWGGLEENVVDRAREKMYQYDIAASAELSKFLPEKWGLSLPIYAQYSNAVSIPEFDPYDRDITLEDKLDNADSGDRDSIRNQAIDQTVIKSFNMSNIRKNRTNKDKKAMPWNIENFSLTYAYTETNRSNPIMEKDDEKTYNGIVTYDYSRPATYITPFKKLIKKDKYLKLITDANFNPLPNTFGFNSNMNRSFRETTYRFVGDNPFFNTFYNKRFTWDRDYNVVWDITKALKFNFTALNRAIIDEKTEFIRLEDDPDGGNVGDKRSQSSINDGILENIRNFGRTETYTHNFTLSYNVPLKKIKPLDWITVKANYSADYGWDAPYPFVPEELQKEDMDVRTGPTDLGYIIQNGHTKTVNGDFSFEKLYKKSKYLDKINKKAKRGRKTSRSATSRDDGGGKGGRSGKGKGRAGSDSNEEVKTEGKGRGSSASGGKGKDSKDKKKRKDGEPSKLERALVRPLLLVRKANLKYQEQRGTLIPGFTPESKYLGMSEDFGAPGWDFVGGIQPSISNTGDEEDWLRRAANEGWITNDVYQNRLVEQSFNQTIEGRLTLEPFQDFRIEIDARRSFTENKALYFKDTIPEALGPNGEIPTELTFASGEIVHAAARDIGSFTTSYFALNTLFNNDITGLFAEFEDNREVISQRLGDELGIADDHLEDEGYKNGLGRTQQDVLLPAFIAAYTGQDVNTVDIGENYARNILFKALPRLNWKVNYTGLSKIEALKEIFSSVGITHGYKSTLTVNSYLTDQEFNPSQALSRRDDQGNFYSRFEIPALSISEQFSPLIGVNMRLKNDMNFTFDYKKARNLNMSFNIDYQLAETKTTEYVFGFGYTMRNVIIGFLIPKSQMGGAKRSKKNRKKKGKKSSKDNKKPKDKNGKDIKGNDLNFTFDFSYRDDITINHRLDQGIAEPTRGSKTLTISPSIDYDISKRLNVRLFYDHRRVIPATSASFPITTNQGGVTIRFSLN